MIFKVDGMFQELCHGCAHRADVAGKDVSTCPLGKPEKFVCEECKGILPPEVNEDPDYTKIDH